MLKISSSPMLNFYRTIYTVVVFLLTLCFTVNAQSSVDSVKKDSVAPISVQKSIDNRPLHQRIGFDLTTSFWMNVSSTFFEFSPVMVYRFPKTYSIGTGPTYIYNRDRIRKIDLNGWGAKVFGKAQFTNWLYAYTEYQGINNQYISGIDLNTNKAIKSTAFVDSWFLSLGMNIRAGKRHGINIQTLYDVLYDGVKSPYYGAWTYRIGFGF
jgi:hypothetical protein